MSVAEAATAEAKVLGAFSNDINKVTKQLKKLPSDVSLLRVCYDEQVPAAYSRFSGLFLQDRGIATGAFKRCDSNTANTISMAPRA